MLLNEAATKSVEEGTKIFNECKMLCDTKPLIIQAAATQAEVDILTYLSSLIEDLEKLKSKFLLMNEEEMKSINQKALDMKEKSYKEIK